MSVGRRSESVGVYVGFYVAESVFCLNLIKKPDTFFSLFKCVSEVRGWPDSLKTLMLQRVFTGKDQRTFPALSAESSDYENVKVAVLKA